MLNKKYLKALGVTDLTTLVERFTETIIDTNRNHKFFVDWGKVQENVAGHKVEFNILNSLIGSAKFDAELEALLAKFPSVLPVIPILIAVRDEELKVIGDFQDSAIEVVSYDFRERKLTKNELKSFVAFFDKTGLKGFFQSLAFKSIQDYVLGVEVGMDTNARKNRSGEAMELLIHPIVKGICDKEKPPYSMLFRQKFEVLESKYGIRVPPSLRPREADFLIVRTDKKAFNIEVNFFSGTGSKPQEIVDSYLNRQRELKAVGMGFIWITDGEGWKGQQNQIRKGFEEFDFLLNLHFVRQGLLSSVLRETGLAQDGKR